MAGYRLTREAADDLVEIWKYIARDDSDAADRVEAAIYQACALVARTPLIGQLCKYSTKLLVRFWTIPQFPNYVPAYRPRILKQPMS